MPLKATLFDLFQSTIFFFPFLKLVAELIGPGLHSANHCKSKVGRTGIERL